MQSPSFDTRGNRIRKAGVMGLVLMSGDVHAGDRTHMLMPEGASGRSRQSGARRYQLRSLSLRSRRAARL